jgi:hypothetical protein
VSTQPISEKKRLANQANAQRSTCQGEAVESSGCRIDAPGRGLAGPAAGPKPTTESQRQNEATAVSSLSPRLRVSVSPRPSSSLHGLFVRSVVVVEDHPDENAADFDQLHEGLLIDLCPAGTHETLLVEQIAACYWRLRRALRFEAQAIHDHQAALANPPSDPSRPASVCPSSPESAVLPDERNLNLLLRYEGMINRELDKAHRQLRTLQDTRKPTAPWGLGLNTPHISLPAPPVASAISDPQSAIPNAPTPSMPPAQIEPTEPRRDTVCRQGRSGFPQPANRNRVIRQNEPTDPAKALLASSERLLQPLVSAPSLANKPLVGLGPRFEISELPVSSRI